MRISFSAEEKAKLLSTIHIWNREQLTQDMFRKLQVKYGIPSYLVYRDHVLAHGDFTQVRGVRAFSRQ